MGDFLVLFGSRDFLSDLMGIDWQARSRLGVGAWVVHDVV